MKLRKLLKEARRTGHYYMKERVEPTYDGKQFEVWRWLPMPPGMNSYNYIVKRLKTETECYDFIYEKKWEDIRSNIVRMRERRKNSISKVNLLQLIRRII